MQQVVVIHGGETFATYENYITYLETYTLDFDSLLEKKNDWKRNLKDDLGETYQVVRPTMPSGKNAKYREWKIWFEKLLPHLSDNVIFVGHSLGGLFLVKYLSENQLPVVIKSVHLVAAPFNDDGAPYSLADFTQPAKYERLQALKTRVHFYHSTDDPVVSFSDFEKYRAVLPETTEHVFKDKKHFFDEHFPELVADIKNVA